MKPAEYQEEWLSAYLDGELTEEHRQIVEERLASDPTALAILDDLKRVRKLVSELAPWSGQDLKVDVGSLGPANQRNFEEVPQSLSDADELRSASSVLAQRTYKPARRFPIAWAASAATILLLLGLGSTLWLQWGKHALALRESAAPAANGIQTETPALPRSNKPPGSTSSRFQSDAINLEKHTELAPPSRELQEPQSRAALTFDTPAPAEPAPRGLARADLADTASAGPAAGGLAAGGLASASQKPAMVAADLHDTIALGVNPPAAAPELPFEDQARAANFGNLYALDAKQDLLRRIPAREADRIRIARSNQWSDAEVQIAFAETMSALGLPDMTSSNSGVESQERVAGTTENSPVVSQGTSQQALLLASIEPKFANSSQFFDDLVAGNRLTAITPSLSAAPASGSSDKANTKAKEQNLNEHRSADSPVAAAAVKEQDVDTQPSEKRAQDEYFYRQQSVGRKIPDSIVFFLTQSEAEQVLEQLKQKGQIASQVWHVAREQEALWYSPQNTSNSAGRLGSRGAIAEQSRVGGEPQDEVDDAALKPATPSQLSEADVTQSQQKKGERTLAENAGRKVILLLSSPPQ